MRLARQRDRVRAQRGDHEDAKREMAEATQAMGNLLPQSPEPHTWGRPLHRLGGPPRWTHAR
eukprot:8208096-Pyramimonas_sp.AAC.1